MLEGGHESFYKKEGSRELVYSPIDKEYRPMREDPRVISLESSSLTPLARLVGFTVGGVRSEVMGIGPTVAIPKVLKLTGFRSTT